MSFTVKPTILECASLEEFFAQWKLCVDDLLITNAYILAPRLAGRPVPCDVIYQEQFGGGEPSDEMVDAMLRVHKGKKYDRVIAIGGGTVIDIAKLFVFGDGLSCGEIFAAGATLPRKRRLIIVPTTCGTGSEVTGISIVEFKKKQTKLGLAVPALFADEAVLIPAMLDSLPFEVFATSSIDALIHAVESVVSPKASVFSRAMACSAVESIISGYRKLAGGPPGLLPAQKDMKAFLEASAMAGIAFANAGVGAVHALSYPIGGSYHVPHGKANYMVFGAVFKAYESKNADLSYLRYVLAVPLGCAPENAFAELDALLDKIYPNTPLSAYGADEGKCAEMAKSVIENQQRLMANNPVTLLEADVEQIYKSCL